MFDTYAAQDVDHQAPRVVALNQIPHPTYGVPKIHVVYAGERNQEWQNQLVLDADGDPTAELGFNKRPEFDATKEAREQDKIRRRLARACVRGLENVHHEDGRAADGPEDVLAFMLAIPWYVVAAILRFVVNPTNFVQDVPRPAASAAAVAAK